MKIVLPADGRAMMIVRSPFLIASKRGADSFAIKGDSFQMTDISAEKILLLPDDVSLSEGETIMPEIAAQALPIEAFLAATAEETLADVLGLVLRAAVADGKITDEELLRVAPALESRAWRTELDVSLGDVYSHGGFLWRCIQTHTTQTGWDPDKTPSIWRKVEIIHEDANFIWQAGVDYALEDGVFYPDENGMEYACITAHTSQIGWEPPNTPALWQKKTSTEAPQNALN